MLMPLKHHAVYSHLTNISSPSFLSSDPSLRFAKFERLVSLGHCLIPRDEV
jgi:hypothetical protein